jgi:hypothetical protein
MFTEAELPDDLVHVALSRRQIAVLERLVNDRLQVIDTSSLPADRATLQAILAALSEELP